MLNNYFLKRSLLFRNCAKYKRLFFYAKISDLIKGGEKGLTQWHCWVVNLNIYDNEV